MSRWRRHVPAIVRSRSGTSRERGSATVEVAMALPALLLVTGAAMWGVAVAGAQVSCVDAARAGARAAARGERPAAVRTAVTTAAPPGARVTVRRSGEFTKVDVIVAIRAPILSGLPALTLRAHAVAATEPGAAVPPGGPAPPPSAGLPDMPDGGSVHVPSGGHPAAPSSDTAADVP